MLRWCLVWVTSERCCPLCASVFVCELVPQGSGQWVFYPCLPDILSRVEKSGVRAFLGAGPHRGRQSLVPARMLPCTSPGRGHRSIFTSLLPTVPSHTHFLSLRKLRPRQ